MNNLSRSTRRHHKQRLENKRSDYWGGNNDKAKLSKLSRTPQVCSCISCGNQRKSYGATHQEKLMDKIANDYS